MINIDRTNPIYPTLKNLIARLPTSSFFLKFKYVLRKKEIVIPIFTLIKLDSKSGIDVLDKRKKLRVSIEAENNQKKLREE